MTIEPSTLIALAGSIVIPIVSVQVGLQMRLESRITRLETQVDERHGEYERRIARLEARG